MASRIFLIFTATLIQHTASNENAVVGEPRTVKFLPPLSFRVKPRGLPDREKAARGTDRKLPRSQPVSAFDMTAGSDQKSHFLEVGSRRTCHLLEAAVGPDAEHSLLTLDTAPASAHPLDPRPCVFFPSFTVPQAKARLRMLALPITLFGETHAQRSARLLLAEEDKGHHQDDFTLADGHNVVSPPPPSFLPVGLSLIVSARVISSCRVPYFYFA